MVTYTGLVAHAGTGKCFTAPSNEGEQMYVTDCDPNNANKLKSRQNITINSDGTMQTEEQYSRGATGLIDTYNGNVYWSSESGKGNDIQFTFNAKELGYPVEEGLFNFYGAGKQGNHDATVTSDMKVTQNSGTDGLPYSLWMPYPLWEKCKGVGLSASECSATAYNARRSVVPTSAPATTAATKAASSASLSPPSPTHSPSSESSGSGLSTFSIVAIVLSVVLVLCLCAMGFFFFI